MFKLILHEPRPIWPFNEPARDLRIQNKPLWVLQNEVLHPWAEGELVVQPQQPWPEIQEPTLVYRDNLYFDRPFVEAFLEKAKQLRRPARVAFREDDPAFKNHMLPLSVSYQRYGDLYLADMWYYPHGLTQEPPEPVVIDLQSREIGYYHIPTYMAYKGGDLTFHVPLRALVAIDTWVHVYVADIIFGLFTRGARFEDRVNRDPFYKFKILLKAMFEGKQVLQSSELVKIGRNCSIDPTAIILGPTTIGDNVTIGAGAVIDNCIIGDNVNIGQGCHLQLSVVGDGAFLPFRASLFMTTLMDNSMVAQNTCLQMCVVGRNTFIGAGTTFTDFNLLSRPIKARRPDGQLEETPFPVLGGAVGHNCRIGSGLVIYPARTIESDVVLAATDERRVITRDVFYEDSDHHRIKLDFKVQRLYPRPPEFPGYPYFSNK
ncbi:MAG: multidrug transporter [Chloroflexi bacterium]|nr:multidrug transporter [Chloroflexota bacterium]